MHLFRLLSLVQGSGCFLHAFFFLLNVYILGAQHIPVTTRKRNILISAWGAPSGEKGAGRGFTVQHWQLEMYKTGQPCKRNRSINAVLWDAQKSNISLDEQKDWQHRLGIFFSLFCFFTTSSIPSDSSSHSPVYSCSTNSTKCWGYHWLQQL